MGSCFFILILFGAIVSWRDCLVGNEDESTIYTSMDLKPVTASNWEKLQKLRYKLHEILCQKLSYCIISLMMQLVIK